MGAVPVLTMAPRLPGLPRAATRLTPLVSGPYNHTLRGRNRRGRCGPISEVSALPTMRPTYPVTELLGDGIGAELSRAVHALADALPIRLDFRAVDFSLANRRARGAAVYDEAVEAILASGVALKHPTVTAEESPNAVLRRRLDLSVIHRQVMTIPGVPTNSRRELDLDIVRLATGGTYDDPVALIGEDSAVSLRIV